MGAKRICELRIVRKYQMIVGGWTPFRDGVRGGTQWRLGERGL